MFRFLFEDLQATATPYLNILYPNLKFFDLAVSVTKSKYSSTKLWHVFYVLCLYQVYFLCPDAEWK